MTMEKFIGGNSRLAQEDAARLNRNLATLETASHAGVTASAAELNVLDGATAITAEINLLAGLTATKAELIFAADLSAQTETVIGAGALSNVLKLSDLALVGAGAVTLATPSAIMAGSIKTVRMTVDNGNVTMALTNVNNVAGASAGTTCTFDDIGDTILLAACGAKWVVVGISGAAIT
jgi:hypothetical protein